MSSEELFFRGPFLMKVLAEELDRAADRLSKAPEKDRRKVLSSFRIEPIVMHFDRIETHTSKGVRDINPFLIRPLSKGDPNAMICDVTEYRIPFSGDERLFRFTVSPVPFYPFGRLEHGHFIISVKDGEDIFLSDKDYQMTLLKECVRLSGLAVECFNEQIVSLFSEVRI